MPRSRPAPYVAWSTLNIVYFGLKPYCTQSRWTSFYFVHIRRSLYWNWSIRTTFGPGPYELILDLFYFIFYSIFYFVFYSIFYLYSILYSTPCSLQYSILFFHSIFYFILYSIFYSILYSILGSILSYSIFYFIPFLLHIFCIRPGAY